MYVGAKQVSGVGILREDRIRKTQGANMWIKECDREIFNEGP